MRIPLGKRECIPAYLYISVRERTAKQYVNTFMGPNLRSCGCIKLHDCRSNPAYTDVLWWEPCQELNLSKMGLREGGQGWQNGEGVNGSTGRALSVQGLGGGSRG